MRFLSSHQRVGFVAGAIAMALTALLFTVCTKDNPTTPTPPEASNFWTFEGKIVNGNGGDLITDSIYIKYIDDSSKTRSKLVTTGLFHIDSLAPGWCSFVFTDAKTDKPSLRYTASIIRAEGVLDSSMRKLQSVTQIVKLFPLTGSLTGTLQTRINDARTASPAANVSVFITYKDSAMQLSSHNSDTATTDSSGTFRFSKLPIGAQPTVQIAFATVGGIDYKADSVNQPLLIAGKVIPMGTITLWPIDAANFNLVSKSYTTIVGTNDSLILTFTDLVDSLSYASIEGVSTPNVDVTSKATGNKLILKPAASLVDGNSYRITVYAYGIKGGKYTRSDVVQAKGKGLIDVVSSNVLDGNKQPLDGLGLSDSMVFSFKSNVTSGNATVTKAGGTPILVNVSFSGKNLVVKPQGTWESTTYTIKISATLSDGTTATFSFPLTTVGGLDFISSNVYNPRTNTAINGIGFADTITVIANKKLASAQATLNLSGSPVPITVTVNGAAIAIVPYDNLRPATAYALTITIKTAEGETKSFSSTFTTASSDFYPLSDNIRFDNDPNKPVLDFTPNGAIVIKMSGTVQSATAQINGGTPAVKVETSHDTIKITPLANLNEGTAYNLRVSAASVSGTVYNENNSNYVNGFYIKSTFRPLTDNIRFDNDANKPVLDFSPNGTIIIKMASPVKTAIAQILGGSNPAVYVVVSNDTIKITPRVNLSESVSYNLKLSAESTTGVIFNAFGGNYVNGFMVSNTFRPIADNIRFDNDPNKPVLDFLPNGTIVIKMSAPVKTATAQITGGSNPAVTTSISNDTIRITPVVNLSEGYAYYLKISAMSNGNVIYTAGGGYYVNGFTVKNTFQPVTSNVRYNNNYNEPILDFAPNAKIVIIMSDSVLSATALLTGSTTVQSDVKISGDTIKVIPQDVLSVNGTYYLTLETKSKSGLTYQASPYFVYGLRVQNKVRVLASNVLSADGLGLSDIPVTTAMYYVLSATPDASTLDVAISPAVNKTVTVSGDTIKVKPVINLTAGTTYTVTIKGKSTDGNIIDLSLGTPKAFTTRMPVYVVASNMRDGSGNAVTNLLPTTELWVKFSRPLADVSKQQLGGGSGTTVSYTFGALNNNATIRISSDTLFAKFIANALPAYGTTVSLTSISLLFTDDTKLGAGAVDLSAGIISKASPNVIATNGMKNNVVVDTFGVTSEAWIVSSLSFLSIDKVKNGPDGLASVGATNLVLTNVRTHGDTIFFRPAARLAYGTEYQAAFEVTLADSTKYTGSDLKLRWKTQQSLYIVSANDMVSGFTAYRPFSVTGDSLVLTFSKAIDTTKTYAIGGLAPLRLIYTWSSDAKTLKVKSVDTLPAKTYVPNPDYSLTAAAEYSGVTVTLTSTDGESWASQATASSAFNSARPDLKIHTVNGIEVLNSNAKVSAVTKGPYTFPTCRLDYGCSGFNMLTDIDFTDRSAFRVNNFSIGIDSGLFFLRKRIFVKI
jgi:hypothetical protein